MTEHNVPIEQNETKQEIPELDVIAKNLLNNSEIANLPEDEQGKVIMDRFIGTLVRRGGIMSKNAHIGEMSPADVLRAMDAIGTLDEHGMVRTVRNVTRTGGLRDGVILLAKNPRTGALFGNLASQLKQEFTQQGKEIYTLTTEAQVDAYIEAGGSQNDNKNAGRYENPRAWIGPVMADFKAVASGQQAWLHTQTLATDLKDRHTITPEAYKREKELYNARTDAHFAGVDIELLRRSAEYMRQRDESVKQDLGGRGLFLATGGLSETYTKSHEKWFERHIESS